MRLFLILTAFLGLSGCFGLNQTPIKAVPCLVLTPRTDALRAGLQANPDTPTAVGGPAVDIILGTNEVCRK
jgi:hypothetical protein